MDTFMQQFGSRINGWITGFDLFGIQRHDPSTYVFGWSPEVFENTLHLE